MARIKQYIYHILIAITQLLNTITGGYPDESTSSRAYRQQHKLRWRIFKRMVDLVFFWQKEHCKQAYESELDRRQTPPQLRN